MAELALHPKQLEVFRSPHRFKTMVAGRRSGKTFLAKVIMITQARKPKQRVWYVAPTYQMARDIMWEDLKASVPERWVKKRNDTRLRIELINGSLIELKGSDKPDMLRGVGLNFVVLDEFQDMKPDTWSKVIRPTLSATRGGALSQGTPKGFNNLHDHYILGQREDYQRDRIWKSWQFPTAESPFVPSDEIEAARSELDPKTFRQEYMACHLPNTKVMLAGGGSVAIARITSGMQLLFVDDNGSTRSCTVEDAGYTGEREITEVTLETGEKFSASTYHKMKIYRDGAAIKLPLIECSHIERKLVTPPLASRDEKLAALVGYSLANGTVTSKRRTYRRKSGDLTVYAPSVAASFYSSCRADLESLNDDLSSVFPEYGGKVGFKRGSKQAYDSYQIQTGNGTADQLALAGAVVGKKVECDFGVPDWVAQGGTKVRRAFLGALWGAEGSTPGRARASAGKSVKRCAMPVLNMSKRAKLFETNRFISEVARMMRSEGIDVEVRETIYGRNLVSTIYINSDALNTIRFFDRIGYLYCGRKQRLARQWSAYLSARLFDSRCRRETVVRLREIDGLTWPKIGRIMNLSSQGAMALYWRIKKNPAAADRAAHAFPHFDDWIDERWDGRLDLLKVKVTSREKRGTTSVYNVRVDSPDHSYLLADGTNNFNSFESMSGRVYYPFDRKEHIGKLEFNPDLPIWVGQDFNIDPMSSVILQPQPSGELWVVDEIHLPASSTVDVCDQLDKKFWRWQDKVVIYPDPAGGYRQTGRGESDLDVFRQRGFKKLKFHRRHPPVADRVNAVNSLMKTARGEVRLRLDESCRHTIKSLEQTIYKEGSRDVDKAGGAEHQADALGYPIEYEFPVIKHTTAGLSI